jgi:hypothetical protein
VTLVELLVALAISGFAMLGGVMLLDQVNAGSAHIDHDGNAGAEAGNGDRLLRKILADARVTPDTNTRFRGDERAADFVALCDRSRGWAESCRVSLMIDSMPDSSAVLLDLGDGASLSLRRFAGHAQFRYFDANARDSTWVRRWEKSIALPAAIGMVREGDSDTTVFPLGPSRD